MFLNKIDDPRDNLDKARRQELIRFAHAHGLKHITGDHPAILIREELRNKGLTNISIQPRPLGAQNQANPLPPGTEQPGAKVITAGASADLARQFALQQAQPAPPPLKPKAPTAKPPRLVEKPKQEMNTLREDCKRLGIKIDRKDKKADLKAKIEAHGKNASQQRQ